MSVPEGSSSFMDEVLSTANNPQPESNIGKPGSFMADVLGTGNQPSPTQGSFVNEVASSSKANQGSFLKGVAELQRRDQDIISGSSFLEKVLDTLNAPQQALFGVLTQEP